MTLFIGVYDEDVVQSKSTKKIGIVIQTAHDDDSSDSDDSTDEEEEKVEKGKIMVGWYTPNSKWSDPDEVKVVNENSVRCYIYYLFVSEEFLNTFINISHDIIDFFFIKN